MVSPTLYFYPRSPCGERLGTPAARPAQAYFYPRSPCGERPLRSPRIALMVGFLSTLSLRRATKLVQLSPLQYGYFYPRSPCGERLQCQLPGQPGHDFYPRSPCGERRPSLIRKKLNHYFYPRSPCGERRHQQGCHQDCQKFLSTLSLRRATVPKQGFSPVGAISIHALLAESDSQWRTLARGI